MKKLFPLFIFLLLLSACAPAQDAALVERNIFYAGSDGDLRTALSLAGYTLVSDPAQADVFVLNGETPHADVIAARVEEGAGLVLILSEDITSVTASMLTGIPMELTYQEDPVSLMETGGVRDSATKEIVWNSAPQVRARYEIVTPLSSVQPLVTFYENGAWYLWRNARGNVFIINAFLGEHNPQIQEWGYFNYLIYHLVERSAGATPMSFADYPASPVAHEGDRNTIFVFLGGQLLLFFGAFVLVRRYSLRHPDALDSLVADRSRFEVQESETKWEKVGFHRPLSGLLGLWLYKRIGYKASVLFLAHFDWSIIKETFRFGFFEMLGGMLVAGGAALEIWVTQSGLVNYAETWGNWILAYNFLLAFTVSTNLFDGIMPAVSEALSSGYKMLSQYYSVQSYKWGAIASAALAAILLVVAPKFIIGSSGEEFQRAAVLAIPLTVFGSIQFLSWLGDAIFLAANRPVLRAVMVLGEQAIRIGLLVVLLEKFQIVALIIAYFVGILVRGAVAYFVAHRYCFPQRFYFWQSLGAPVLAAGLHYLFLNLIASFVWQGDEISSVLLFFIGLVPAMPFFFFFYALAGGWDDAGLEEVIEASQMTGFLRSVVNVVFVLPSIWGAKLSPLHNRFPINMHEAAMVEAQALTEEKVNLAGA